ncbi:hypothetical protein WT27_12910 [Burkholderia territorii]|uniref:Uncharacterized protein n=1 Tax=Burkholderia territorii TaxID=1503055 RepID=A0A105V3R4_9BURK|nr:hypothetical protein [Burkholderia territorii]KVV40825.1 hypothetical protein WT27_12910 [Burkholderia territorii]KVX33772.1 hypothetical protein WT31_08810 [Burkholderia territorii]
MEHHLYTNADLKDKPEGSTLYRLVCEGGLGICKVCGLGEGSLTTECPGERSGAKADDVYAGKIDYVDGRWQSGRLNPTNQMWARFTADRAENSA